MLLRLGGYAGGRGDNEPGAQSVGIGLRRLMDLTAEWTLRKQRKSTINDEKYVSGTALATATNFLRPKLG